MTDFVPVNEPLFLGNERQYLDECVTTGWVSSDGPFVGKFEDSFAASVQRKHGIAVTNGTTALEVAVKALGIGPGDEVIVPSFTIVSCLSAIIRAGAVPVLVDSDPVTWNMNAEDVVSRITDKTRAIMIVHIYGLPVDVGPILAAARDRGIMVIEDAAEAIGQTWRDKPCGSFGDVSVFSFYANKHITTGEGGMVVTDDDGIAERVKSLRNLCFGKIRFVHEELGWNMRMSNIQAALGLAQLEQLQDTVARKKAMGRRYQEMLGNIGCLQLPLTATDYAENVYWVFGVVLSDEVKMDAALACAALGKLGIGTRPFFWPMHEQPVFQEMGLFRGETYPVSERLARRGFYIPSGLALTEAAQERVSDALHQIFRQDG